MDIVINIDSTQYDTLRKTLGVSDTPRLVYDEDIKVVATAIMDSPTHGTALVNSIVDLHGDKIAESVAGQIDCQVIADCIDLSDLANHVDTSLIDTADIAGCIDTSDLAREFDVQDIADCFDTADVANALDLHDIAQRVDTTEIADMVVEKIREDQTIKTMESVSVQEVVDHLNHKQIALHLVQSVVHNEELRNCLINALIERLMLTVPMSDEFLKNVEMARTMPSSRL